MSFSRPAALLPFFYLAWFSHNTSFSACTSVTGLNVLLKKQAAQLLKTT